MTSFSAPTSPRRRAALSAGLALVVGALALAPGAKAASAGPATAPTIGEPTIIVAGQKTPVDIGGNHLHHGQKIRKGYELRRWAVTMHGRSNASVTLSCPAGTVHTGLGLQSGSKVAFAVAKGSGYYRRTIDVRFYAAPKVDPDGAHGHVYALCKSV
jgi:hypothetical protein